MKIKRTMSKSKRNYNLHWSMVAYSMKKIDNLLGKGNGFKTFLEVFDFLIKDGYFTKENLKAIRGVLIDTKKDKR